MVTATHHSWQRVLQLPVALRNRQVAAWLGRVGEPASCATWRCSPHIRRLRLTGRAGRGTGTTTPSNPRRIATRKLAQSK